MSVDEQSANNIQRRISRTAKLSLASKEDLINSRRVSRAAIHFTETGDFGFTLVEQLKLTRQLSYRNAKAKELFQKMCIVEGFSANKCCDMKEHVRCLIDLFDFAVADLNSPSKHVQDKCIQIGEIHYNMCGSTAAGIWDDLGNAVTEAISRTEPVRGKREALKAWISLISFLVDCMRGGYMAQCKRKSITRASGHFTSLSITPQNNIEHCPILH
uniref:Globin family profile domain-containing protein n=1 Tax=Panagrolaimus davidi TaxID=227884 RepID=A0A914PHS4_9BILA